MLIFAGSIKQTGENQKVELPVNKDHIADVLASLIVDGPVQFIAPPSFVPENDEDKLMLSPDSVFQDIFKKLRGAEVEILASSDTLLVGKIFGLDSEEAAIRNK